jgi:zinc transport system ATP-binding protein
MHSPASSCCAANLVERLPVPADAPPVIELSDVSYSYGDVEVLSNVDLMVRAGDFLTIIGPNGGGKTTLVKIMLGLLSPRSGCVCVLGEDPVSVRPAVGYVPQHASVQPNFPVTVREVVLLGLPSRKRFPNFGRLPGYSTAQKNKALETLALVDMADFSERRFNALSGGQKQRVLVARALVSDPSLLLFDEPTANIDPQGKICLFDLLSVLSASITIVMVSHDLISASTRITGVAAVNRNLIQSNGRELTPRMLELIYGAHDASCPLDGYIRGVSSIFTQAGRDT